MSEERDDRAEQVLAPEAIVLDGGARTRGEAITEAGRLLVACGAVEPSYVESMHERERSVSTYMGNTLAIPHGTNEAKAAVRRTALSFVRYPDGVDWDGNPVEFVVGIAGVGSAHLGLLSRLAGIFVHEALIQELRDARSAPEVLRVLESG